MPGASRSPSPWRPRVGRIAAVLVLVGGVALAVWMRRRSGIELDPASLREWIEGQGWRAPLLFVMAATFRMFLVLPSWVVMSAGGLLFGVAGGTALGTAGFTLGALLAFGISRALGREALEGRLSGGLARMDAYLKRRGARWIALYTAVPVSPLTPAHGAAGLSGLSAGSFALGVTLGLVPRTFLFSLFGDTLASGDVGRIAGAALALVAVAAVGMAVVRRAAGRSDPGADQSPPDA